jgi:hypothetical protein
MAGQLDHLVKLADSPGADGPATMFEFADERPVAYLVTISAAAWQDFTDALK